jgi:hypothetical protein
LTVAITIETLLARALQEARTTLLPLLVPPTLAMKGLLVVAEEEDAKIKSSLYLNKNENRRICFNFGFYN